MTRLYIDGDGTVFEWKIGNITLDDLMTPGYFAKLNIYPHVIEALKNIKEKQPEIEMVFLSKVLNDTYIIDDKNKMVDKYLPFIDKRIYVPYHHKKIDYIENITSSDILLDDYTKNLREWNKAGGHAIKLLNGCNGNHGTWEGQFIHKSYPTWLIEESIMKIINSKGDKNEIQKNK